MNNYEPRFDLSALESLDQFALLARQDYNLGNRGKWFRCFRGGIYGFHARVYTVQVHFDDVHRWIPRLRLPVETEHHASAILFGMDSALECFVYALNALGWAAAPSEFLNVTHPKSLRQVAPWNIVGTSSRSALAGHSKLFPTLQEHWQQNVALLQTITDLHDASKHRATVVSGGRYRSDPPPGFYESLGITKEQAAEKFLHSPMAEILLLYEPKSPPSTRPQPANRAEYPTLEKIVYDFHAFAETSCARALKDAVQSIQLPHQAFLKR